MYTGVYRITRSMPGGRLLEFNGDIKSREMTDACLSSTGSGL